MTFEPFTLNTKEAEELDIYRLQCLSTVPLLSAVPESLETQEGKFKSFALFKLPLELRVKIYEFASGRPEIFQVGIAYTHYRQGQVRGIDLCHPMHPDPLKDAFREAREWYTTNKPLFLSNLKGRPYAGVWLRQEVDILYISTELFLFRTSEDPSHSYFKRALEKTHGIECVKHVAIDADLVGFPYAESGFFSRILIRLLYAHMPQLAKLAIFRSLRSRNRSFGAMSLGWAPEVAMLPQAPISGTIAVENAEEVSFVTNLFEDEGFVADLKKAIQASFGDKVIDNLVFPPEIEVFELIREDTHGKKPGV